MTDKGESIFHRERAKGPLVSWYVPHYHKEHDPNKSEVPAYCAGGKDAAEWLAERHWHHEQPAEAEFEIVIVIPKGWAGTYSVKVESEPVFLVRLKGET